MEELVDVILDKCQTHGIKAVHERMSDLLGPSRDLHRYRELVDKKYLGGLTVPEEKEVMELMDRIDEYNRGFYEPVIHRVKAVYGV